MQLYGKMLLLLFPNNNNLVGTTKLPLATSKSVKGLHLQFYCFCLPFHCAQMQSCALLL